MVIIHFHVTVGIPSCSWNSGPCLRYHLPQPPQEKHGQQSCKQWPKLLTFRLNSSPVTSTTSPVPLFSLFSLLPSLFPLHFYNKALKPQSLCSAPSRPAAHPGQCWERLPLFPLFCNPGVLARQLRAGGGVWSAAAPFPPPPRGSGMLTLGPVEKCPAALPVSACPEHRRNSGPMWAIHPLSPFPCPLLVLTPQHTYSRGLPGLCAFRDDTPNRGPREFRGQVGWWVWTSTWRQSRVRRRCGM